MGQAAGEDLSGLEVESSMKYLPNRSAARLGSLALGLLLVSACGDDTTPPPPLDATIPVVDGNTTPVAPGDAGVPSDAGTSLPSLDASVPNDPSKPALYISSSRVFDTAGSNGYLFSFGSIEKGTKIDLKQAIEIEDAWVFGDAKPYFYTATIFAPQLTRWTVASDGKLVQGPTLDLVNKGVKGTYSAAAVPQYRADKAYFVDAPSLQVVVWNPTDMTFIKTIPIDMPSQGTLNPTLDSQVVFRGNRMFVVGFYADPNSMNTRYGSSSRVFAIDTATDTVVSSVEEPRCGSMTAGGVTSNGTIWYSPWDYHAAVRGVFGEGFGSSSCGVRIQPNSDSTDAAYTLDLTTVTGGRPAGGLYVLDDTQALLHVFHNDLVSATAANWSDTRFNAGYLWHRWRFGETTSEPLPNQTPSSEGGGWQGLDNKTVTYVPDAEYANTTLWELLADGTQRELLTVPGWTTNIVRAN